MIGSRRTSEPKAYRGDQLKVQRKTKDTQSKKQLNDDRNAQIAERDCLQCNSAMTKKRQKQTRRATKKQVSTRHCSSRAAVHPINSGTSARVANDGGRRYVE